MKATELNSTKIEIIQWISNLKDDKFIRLINSFRISKSDTDFWEGLSSQQKKDIDTSIDQLDKGKGITLAEFRKKHR